MDKQKVVTPETTRIIIDVDHDFLALMERIRELKGHQGSSTQELLKLAMNNFVKRHELTLRTPKVQENSNAFNSNSLTSQSRYISAKIRNEIRARSGDQCEYVDSVTKRRCQCRIKLEFDHVIPYALGGQTSFENLRHYCSAHNKLSAIRHFGQLHMNPFLKN